MPGCVHAVINQLVNLQRLPKNPRAAANCPWLDGINTVVGLVTIAGLERRAALVHAISAQVDPHATLIRRVAKRLKIRDQADSWHSHLVILWLFRVSHGCPTVNPLLQGDWS
jgi:hypothetical protein